MRNLHSQATKTAPQFLQRQLSHRGERNSVTGNVLKCSTPLFLQARLSGCHLHLQTSIAKAMNIYPPLCNMEPDRGGSYKIIFFKGPSVRFPVDWWQGKCEVSTVQCGSIGSHPWRHGTGFLCFLFKPHLANRELPWHSGDRPNPSKGERNGAQLRERPPGTQGRTGLEAIDHVVMALNWLGFGPKWLQIQKDYAGS